MVEMTQSKILSTQPFALSIGPRRCATSWIYRYLGERGDVCLPKGVKETRYFDRNHHQGRSFYDSHFKPKKHHKILAEIGTTFFHLPEAPQRVEEHFGTDHPIKLLCPLRHPIIRSYSEYHHMVRYGQIMPGLRDACKDTPNILNSSRYAEHIQRWSDRFGLDALHFLFKEDLDTNPQAFIAQLCNALDLPFMDISPSTRPRYNATAHSKFPMLARASGWDKRVATIPYKRRASSTRPAWIKASPVTLQASTLRVSSVQSGTKAPSAAAATSGSPVARAAKIRSS